MTPSQIADVERRVSASWSGLFPMRLDTPSAERLRELLDALAERRRAESASLSLSN